MAKTFLGWTGIQAKINCPTGNKLIENQRKCHVTSCLKNYLTGEVTWQIK